MYRKIYSKVPKENKYRNTITLTIYRKNYSYYPKTYAKIYPKMDVKIYPKVYQKIYPEIHLKFYTKIYPEIY